MRAATRSKIRLTCDGRQGLVHMPLTQTLLSASTETWRGMVEDGTGAGVDLYDRAPARGGDPDEGEGADLIGDLQLIV